MRVKRGRVGTAGVGIEAQAEGPGSEQEGVVVVDFGDRVGAVDGQGFEPQETVTPPPASGGL